ncbi:MAG TPA: hypothetical protein VK524_17595, partial [Polyangiaceae bacterium]|nr:hypothetical protein [Polyangiaceae bacterium]
MKKSAKLHGLLAAFAIGASGLGFSACGGAPEPETGEDMSEFRGMYGGSHADHAGLRICAECIKTSCTDELRKLRRNGFWRFGRNLKALHECAQDSCQVQCSPRGNPNPDGG